MDEGTKKGIMIAVIVLCLAVAGWVLYSNIGGGGGGIEGIGAGEKIWVKCNKCGAEYQMSKKDYYEYIKTHMRGISTPPLPCKECGEEALYRAVKCEKCGHIFFYGQTPNDYSDRCPECGYSATEAKRKDMYKK